MLFIVIWHKNGSSLLFLTQVIIIIEGDRKYRDENESFRDHGFTEKEFVGEELEDVELNEEPDDSDLENLSFDDDDYLGEE